MPATQNCSEKGKVIGDSSKTAREIRAKLMLMKAQLKKQTLPVFSELGEHVVKSGAKYAEELPIKVEEYVNWLEINF